MTDSSRTDSAERELLDLSAQLLRTIHAGDWAAYAAFCAPDLTCFEPEAKGHLVAGLDFHKFYFDMPGNGRPRQSTIAAPHVRVMGDVAVVCYVRLVQRIDADGSAPTTATEETRVWRKIDGRWRHVHFHRSPVA